jgi:hypothetical protein
MGQATRLATVLAHKLPEMRTFPANRTVSTEVPLRTGRDMDGPVHSEDGWRTPVQTPQRGVRTPPSPLFHHAETVKPSRIALHAVKKGHEVEW